MPSIQVVSTLEEFKTLSEKWNALLKETASNRIFQTWEWQYIWAKHYLGSNRLLILLVYEENHLIGIAPLYIGLERGLPLLKPRRLAFLGGGEVCPPYLDFIIPEKKKKGIIPAVLSYLYTEVKGWDILVMDQMPADSSSLDYLYRFFDDAGKVIEIVGQTCCPVIRLAGESGDFLKDIGGNERYNLKRKRRTLEQAGTVEWRRIDSSLDLEKEMAAFAMLHQMRWKAKGKQGSFQSERFSAFHREISALCLDRDWLRLDFLLLNGEKIAGVYGFFYEGVYSFYLPGLNPVVAPEASAGRLLLYQVIEQERGEGCVEFDLLRGDADYKMAWANGRRRSLTLAAYHRGFRPASFKIARSIKDTIKVIVR